MKWRLIFTDTESLSGVAPECETTHPLDDGCQPLVDWVYDCCPHPQIDLWSEVDARRVLEILNEAEAGMAGA